MAKRRIGIIIFLICYCLCMVPCSVQAASTEDASEPISTDADCTLTAIYQCNGTALGGLDVLIYRIADVSADFQYSLTASYANSGLILNGVRSTGEWKTIRSTLEAYILANNIKEDSIATTDQNGQVTIEGLKPGMYLLMVDTVVMRDFICSFDSSLVALPGLGNDGLWQYQVTVAAKGEMLPPVEPDEEIVYKVVKLWKNDEGQNARPKGVEVEIFRNGVSQRKIVLSEYNQWSYSWTAKNDGANWIVVERNVPEGYSMTVEERTSTFVITNTYGTDEPDTPPTPPAQTGDSYNVMLYIVLMFVSGGLLLVLGFAGKRKGV